MIEQIKLLTTGMLLFRAMYTDVKEGRIENPLIVTGLACGILFAAIRGGPQGIWQSIGTSAVVCMALFFLFVLKGLGAGDIKLFCVLAMFFPNQITGIIAVSFFAGGVWALGRMVLRRIRGQAFYIRHETINFSIPIFTGTVLVLFKDHWR